MTTNPKLLSRSNRAKVLAAGAVALAAGGTILVRSPASSQTLAAAPQARPPVAQPTAPALPPGPTRLAFTGPHVHGRVALGQSSVLANGTRQLYGEIRVAADGTEPTNRNVPETMRPVALAVVLDTSGSMEGEKIEQARRAVTELVDRMRDFDQISFVTYSDTARVVQPLARVSTVRAQLRQMISTVRAGGGTMIPLGLETGAQSLNEAPSTMVRRIVLVSDGQDTSGTALATVADQVRARSRSGVTLSSLGIGTDFDERFLTTVADAGHGNYEFLRNGSQLAGFLARELTQASATLAQNVNAEITLPAGVRVMRAYGAEVSTGQTGTVRVPIGALFAGDERRVVLEFAVDAGAVQSTTAMRFGVTYTSVPQSRAVTLDAGALAVRSVATEAEAQASRDIAVYAEAESTAIAQRQQLAVDAWRRGDRAEADRIVQANVAQLGQLNERANSAAITAQIAEYRRDQGAFDALSAGSEEGRAYGLNSNSMNRARAMRSSH